MTHPLPSLSAQGLEQRLQALLLRVQQLPHHGSRPLTVGGRVAGWITPKATDCVRGIDGVRVCDEAVHVGHASVSRAVLSRRLAQMAEAMKAEGCLRGWRNELLDVIGEGRRLAAIERAAVRPLGLLTHAVHLNAWTPDGRLWVARRSESKSTDPGLWDTLVGGLSGSGEKLEESLLRESNEEAGLNPQDIETRSPLHTILRMHKQLPEGFQVEDIVVSECVLPESVAPRNLDGEVSEISAVTLNELWQMMRDGVITLEAELVIIDSLLRLHRQRL